MKLLCDNQKRSVKLAMGKGSPNWLTVLPITEHGFTLHKDVFRDALALHYGWTPERLLPKCECGVTSSVDHAFSCPKGGFPPIRHNEIRDLTAALLNASMQKCMC